AEDGIRGRNVTGVQTCALPISYYEVHEPLDEYERWELVSQHVYRPLEIDPPTDSNGVARPGYKKDLRRQKLSRFFFEDRIEPVTPAELAAAQAQHDSDIAELEGQPLEEISK